MNNIFGRGDTQYSMYSVNEMFPEKITKLEHEIVPFQGFEGDSRKWRTMKNSMIQIINILGEQSAKAQGLSKVITTAEKLINSKCLLYLLNETNANSGKGEIVGFLKIGPKKLYLHDNKGVMMEREPMCVLDFYVVPEYQRHGYGKQLFDYMLKDNRLLPKKMAIDGPSPKMIEFIKKYYGMKNVVKHENNFLMDESFFGDVESASDSSGRSTPTTSYHGSGRYSAVPPPSHLGNIIHGGDNNRADFIRPTSRGFAYSPKPQTSAALGMTPVAVPILPETEPITPASQPERPSSLHIADTETLQMERLAINADQEQEEEPNPDNVSENVEERQLTKEGYYDLKYYHNKLW